MTRRAHWLANASVLTLMALSGCSDPIADDKRTFVAQCYPGIRDKKLCECMFDELIEDHSSMEIADAATSREQPSPAWRQEMAKVTVTCLRKR